MSVFSISGSNAQDGHLAAARNGVKRLRTVSLLLLSSIYHFILLFCFIITYANANGSFLILFFSFQVRHPNILSFLHSTEAETLDASTTKQTIYIVTEPVMPLSEKIKELSLQGIQRYFKHKLPAPLRLFVVFFLK